MDALAAAATPPPWVVDTWDGDCWGVAQGDITGETVAENDNEQDAAFIAAARTAIPALIAEVRRLRVDNAVKMNLLLDAAAQYERLRGADWPFTTFHEGDRVRKKSGSSWHGRIVGWYRTSLTPEGYAVESEREPGSVQIYPVAALEKADD